jgi:DNA-binding NarL/FixJ family response regulator
VSPIRILIADDHRVYREGVRVLLQDLEDVELIGEAADGDETVLQAERLSPDVILMDPQIAILVLTMYDDDESVFNAMRSGARGYLLKDADQ